MKVYNSKGKIEVIDFLRRNTERRITAAEILQGLQKSGKTINRSTVYRNLEKLTESGEILCFREHDSEAAYYQYTGENKECNSHLHLQCSTCGKIFHLEDEFTILLRERCLSGYGVEIDGSKTMLVGICGHCRDVVKA